MRIFGSLLLAAGLTFAGDNTARSHPSTNRRHHPEIRRTRSRVRQSARRHIYKQTARIQELEFDSGNTTGRWETVLDIIFASDGKRTEHVTPLARFHFKQAHSHTPKIWRI